MTSTSTNDQAIADTLREVANRLDTLTAQGLPICRYVSLTFQPDPDTFGDDAATITAVDAVASALLGAPATSRELSGGVWHHTTHGYLGPVHIGVFGGIRSPEQRALTDEITRLRAEVAAQHTTTGR